MVVVGTRYQFRRTGIALYHARVFEVFLCQFALFQSLSLTYTAFLLLCVDTGVPYKEDSTSESPSHACEKCGTAVQSWQLKFHYLERHYKARSDVQAIFSVKF